MLWRVWPWVVLLSLAAACAPDPPRRAQGPPTPVSTRSAVVAASPAATGLARAPSATPPPTATPAPGGLRATALAIPALNLSAPVQASRVVPADSYPATPGCPPSAPGETTLTVPDHGIATPEEALEGLEGKAWIFGHSRWQNEPGLFFRLQDINLGDELVLDGFDRATGARVTGSRFVVDGIFLADIESGTRLVDESTPGAGGRPLVILQTSVREDGAGKGWLLDERRVVAKARNIVAGDLADPCRYLLLFVLARTR